MEVSIERLIELIVKEITAELSRRGIAVIPASGKTTSSGVRMSQKHLQEMADLKNYKTPVLTENHLASLESSIREILLPKGTVVTPGARDIILKRKLIIRSDHRTN